MPAYREGDEDFKIEVAAPEEWIFDAGDTIIGSVGRKSPIVSPKANIKIALRGQIHTIITADTRNERATKSSQSTGPGCDKQIYPEERHEIFHGPLHVAEGSEPLSLPFEFRIPLRWSVKTLPGQNARDGSLPSYEDVPSSPLPGSFVYYGKYASTWIEYFLEATLLYHHGNKTKLLRSTCPFQLRRPSSSHFRSFGTKTSPFVKSVQSYHLLPKYDGARTPIFYKTREFFGSSKVPHLDYQMIVSLPSTIQLGNPEYIPIRVRLSMIAKTSNLVKESIPKISIGSVKLSLATCVYLYPDTIANQEDISGFHIGYESSKFDLALSEAMRSSCEIFMGEENEIDIGRELQLTLGPDGLRAGGRLLKKCDPIVPDFDVKFIKYTHNFDLRFKITIAGQSEKVAWETAVNILGA